MFNSVAKFFVKAFKTPSIRKKLFITGLVIIVFRLAAHIPAAGIDRTTLATLFAGSPLLSLLDVFSGGTLANFSILALGLNPYINASIIFQLLGYVVPSIQELQKEGEYGQEKINQYTRLLTVPLAALQAFGMYALLKGQNIIPSLGPTALLSLVVTMTAGTVFAVWLGELITEYGFKNGVSVLIFVGIVARLPITLGQSASIFQTQDILKMAIFVAVLVLIVGLVVFVSEAIRQVPIHYAKRKTESGLAASSYLPIRLNQAGVIPIIFAVSLVLMPSMIGQFLASVPNAKIASIALAVSTGFSSGTVLYNVVYFLLVFGFTYFYTAVVFNPEKISEDLQKGGGFIPGIRPGKETEKYLSHVLSRITVVGGAFLGVIAVLPSLFQNTLGASNLAIGGTSILIIVSVVLEIIREIEGELVMERYEGFS
ncbi:MAG: preprotein translocase, SecY subunit, preprotein translocase subunit SecY [Microgenomates group bacterium GW2011_GWC1_41_20]|uniref:Protein translocase subunit SecY n=7 Tax=Candidatus Woeseibacteriota TaxID=1752722 RepID=A0A0G0V110_9BACT|nr:MAG: Protein translocase subunit SecY [Candidatus Woesebacteria bacterium GW2011_GWB1_40_12]KKR56232.1 MAG: Protein translocase subunit SecY [Candidatus Woesebacteria bacterium GW2011_GWF1_40_24]KKR90738.1 MAG: Protein translocase subunit SecY [Candidatus Woesebacteria bacterium GW2011_GWD1_41_12]KKS00789.1 MAG: preprotein translocase, SecY subunit, preprotein translocase subunit SecY [Microgenomates group bacterium GW2011_GWC1_41_20]KKS05772.1 MAG: Protein translocase subunit SecY [Candidat